MHLYTGSSVKIMLSNGELVVALRRQINDDRHQNADDIDEASDHDRMVDCEYSAIFAL
jgi:hypothetical protein